MRFEKGRLSIACVCMVLGFMLAIQFRTTQDIKDVSGTLQLQPVKGVMIGFFGWTGNFTANGITVNRNRYEIVGKYDYM